MAARLSFIAYLFILGAAAALVWFTQETARDPDRSRLELRPKLTREIPRAFRRGRYH